MKRRIKRVLLFNSPAFTFKKNLDINPVPQLGLAYIGAVLERMGIETKIYDALIEGWHKREQVKPGIIRIGSTSEQIKQQIIDFHPDIVGVNNLFTRQRENAHRIYALAKEVNPDIVTIAGGAHPTVMPYLVMEDTNVDFVAIGEGEETIKDLVEYLEGRKTQDELNGIAFRKNGKTVVVPKTSFIEDLDELPFPAWHLLNMEKYFGLPASHGKRRHRFFAPIITSRGCPAGCTFCSTHRVWGRGYRRRTAENVIKEMRELKDRYGIKELMFEDDNVTLDMQRAQKLFDLMIEEKLNFVWDTPNGVAVFALNEKLIDKMKTSGCYKINFAIESGSQRVLNEIIKKPLNLKKIEPLIKYAKSIGLEVGIVLILGMPGETTEEMWESFKFAQRLGVYDPYISIATPYPGSQLYAECLKRGYVSKDFSLDDLYISSYLISTEIWSSNDLRKIFEVGNLYLKRFYYKQHPLIFAKDLTKRLLTNPTKAIRKIRLLSSIGKYIR